MPNLKDLIKDNKVKFSFYRAGFLYYTIFSIDHVLYQFPVPISDTEDASFLAEDKAILFMRYIRKAIENNELEKIT